MRIYEELFIVKPDVEEEAYSQFVKGLEELITSNGGAMEKTDVWGKRRLAYDVKGYGEGIYVLMVFTAPNNLIREMERRLRVADMVIKYLTVRVDEDRKRLAKKTKQRERRASRRPAPMAAPPRPAPPPPAQEEPVEAPGKPTEEAVESAAE
ncbi:MAG: 30S ribosomal protein S6 [Bryobacterales bacterium]|nr:30S ribosomal protein S6 [Bryobacterales bacterium]